MAAGIAEDLDHEIRGSVDDLGMLAEIRHRVDVTADLEATHHAIEIAVAGRFDLGDDVEAAYPGRGLRVRQFDDIADLADMRELAVHDGHLAGDPDVIAALYPGHVIGQRGYRVGNDDAQFHESRFNLAGHSCLPLVSRSAARPATGAAAHFDRHVLGLDVIEQRLLALFAAKA